MSLHFTLRVNGTAIGAMTIRRTDPVDVAVPVPDTVCTYWVERYDGTRKRSCELRHRYGDGAWALAQAALEEIGALAAAALDG